MKWNHYRKDSIKFRTDGVILNVLVHINLDLETILIFSPSFLFFLYSW